MPPELDAPMHWPVVGTASVVDVLEQEGIEGVILAGARGRGRFVGPALTVELAVDEAADPFPRGEGPARQVDIAEMWNYLDSAPRGSVLVISTNAQPVTTVGGVTAATALGRGIAGIVTDGGIRDTDEIYEYAIPIRHLTSDPRAMRDRTRLRSCGQPVRFGEVRVAVGDLVVGDGDGVVCVPRDVAAGVIERALVIEGRERVWAQSARSLRSIAASFDEVSRVHGRPH
ncbi:RraA family protein [Frankia sp. CNm7]|uniref:Putative 4-hydroxy-4-methyl-2-oxoglutarate aldolase n=1 Tax=Frankia nepalensis TaxID=1836974 RepID=A0A937RJI5_9ACTN|nr:RraA family protein [Frankia nepalensis]MBL7501973.1 RraA family protein [Frankia nepalensis]MBL7510603.1 RraA family protein [Frankia nepalensis]MBL7517343.1 RraA family protein [Frankia nepalensis]MBL7633426.1 RraA family protein [Frankia nepalensis]